MRVQTRQAYHRCVQQVIEHVLHSPGEMLRVAEIARSVGFSRYHLNRLFAEQMGESIGAFARRMRLERAAYLLQNCPASVMEIACELDYANPEVFARAFQAAFGQPPSVYRQAARLWHLPSESGLHWQENSAAAIFAPRADGVPVYIVTRPPLRIAALSYTGEYRQIVCAWERLVRLLPDRPWEKTRARLLTLYHDDGKIAAKRTVMRADVGFTVETDYVPPKGMRLLMLPGGQFAQSQLCIDARQHTETWDYMNAAYIPKTKRRPKNIPGLDEYRGLPLPWESRRARVLIGLEMDLGEMAAGA